MNRRGDMLNEKLFMFPLYDLFTINNYNNSQVITLTYNAILIIGHTYGRFTPRILDLL